MISPLETQVPQMFTNSGCLVNLANLVLNSRPAFRPMQETLTSHKFNSSFPRVESLVSSMLNNFSLSISTNSSSRCSNRRCCNPNRTNLGSSSSQEPSRPKSQTRLLGALVVRFLAGKFHLLLAVQIPNNSNRISTNSRVVLV